MGHISIGVALQALPVHQVDLPDSEVQPLQIPPWYPCLGSQRWLATGSTKAHVWSRGFVSWLTTTLIGWGPLSSRIGCKKWGTLVLLNVLHPESDLFVESATGLSHSLSWTVLAWCRVAELSHWDRALLASYPTKVSASSYALGSTSLGLGRAMRTRN